LICPTGAKARVSERGYNNLKPHVITSHLADIPSVVQMYRSSKDQEDNGNNTLLNYAGFVGQRMSPAGTQLFSCLEYCILEDAPLSCFGKPMMRKYSKIQYCCEKTLRKNFLRVGYLTALNIKRDLPPKFGLIFDGKLVNLSHIILTNFSISYYRMDSSLCQRTICSHLSFLYEEWNSYVSFGGMLSNGRYRRLFFKSSHEFYIFNMGMV
jgi:hypothetical protein